MGERGICEGRTGELERVGQAKDELGRDRK